MSNRLNWIRNLNFSSAVRLNLLLPTSLGGLDILVREGFQDCLVQAKKFRAFGGKLTTIWISILGRLLKEEQDFLNFLDFFLLCTHIQSFLMVRASSGQTMLSRNSFSTLHTPTVSRHRPVRKNVDNNTYLTTICENI